MLLALAACGDRGPGNAEAGFPFGGAVVADEPRAAQVAARILREGGSAADAAVALYFALAVTYPSAASLGGGGVCLVHDPDEAGVVALSFLSPRAAPTPGAIRPTAVPANVRGMAALHARFGDLDWRMVLAPAERGARLGVPVSRAAAQTYAAAAGKLLGDGESRRVFAANGRVPSENQLFMQPDLADTLAQLRIHGASAFYEGPLASELVAGVREAGGTLSHQDLTNFAPSWQVPLAIEFGNDNVYFSSPPAGAGLVAGQMWRMLTDRRRYERAGEVERLHLLAESASRAFAGRTRWLADDGTSVDAESLISGGYAREAMRDYDPDRASSVGAAGLPAPRGGGAPASTGFVAADVLGGVVACNFTAYEPFGTGVIAPGTGVLIAPAPGPDQRNPLSLGAVIVANPFVRNFTFAATGGDGAEGVTALTSVLAEAVVNRRQLAAAVGRPRVHGTGGPDLWIESDVAAEAVSALEQRGHGVRRVSSLGQVNAIYCPSGFPAEPDKILCWAESDPRGLGLDAYPR